MFLAVDRMSREDLSVQDMAENTCEARGRFLSFPSSSKSKGLRVSESVEYEKNHPWQGHGGIASLDLRCLAGTAAEAASPRSLNPVWRVQGSSSRSFVCCACFPFPYAHKYE